MPGVFIESDCHSFDAALPDCAVLPLPLPSLVVPSPACPLPAAHLAPTVDYPSLAVCTQLRSGRFVFGIAPVLHSGPEHVQATSHIAVDGPTSLIRSPVSVQSLCTVAPKQFLRLLPLPCSLHAPRPSRLLPAALSRCLPARAVLPPPLPALQGRPPPAPRLRLCLPALLCL